MKWIGWVSVWVWIGIRVMTLRNVEMRWGISCQKSISDRIRCLVYVFRLPNIIFDKCRERERSKYISAHLHCTTVNCHRITIFLLFYWFVIKVMDLEKIVVLQLISCVNIIWQDDLYHPLTNQPTDWKVIQTTNFEWKRFNSILFLLCTEIAILLHYNSSIKSSKHRNVRRRREGESEWK